VSPTRPVSAPSPASAGGGGPRLELRGLTKSFAAVQAVRDLSLRVEPGEVVGLVGENGAGKSTVVKMLAGVVRPDAGTIVLDGEEATISSPSHASALGISVIHQELKLVDRFTLAENLFLGRPRPRRGPFIDWRGMRREAEQAFERFGHAVDVTKTAAEASVWERWVTEVVRALMARGRVLILDEPTAAMDAADVDNVLSAVRRTSADGTSIIFVSHRLDEVLEICDHVHAMRNGASVADVPRAELSRERLIALIAGDEANRRAQAARHQGSADDAAAIAARGISLGRRLHDVSFTVRAGEIVGLAGLVGSGRSSVLRVLAGIETPTGGDVEVRGVPASLSSPRAAQRAGIGFLPEDRLTQGLVDTLDVAANMSLGALDRFRRLGLVIDRPAERRSASTWIGDLDIAGARPEGAVLSLSGGNQQKVVFARCLGRQPDVLLLDEPTRGVDVGARAELYALIAGFVGDGGAVLVATSELEELVELADRAVVLREGRVVGEIPGSELDKETILRMCYSDD
jgi:ABC-type sugar transport system ATPase subunit